MLQCPLEGGHRPRVAIEQLVPDVHDLGGFHGHLAASLYRASAIFAITSHAVEIFAVACNLLVWLPPPPLPPRRAGRPGPGPSSWCFAVSSSSTGSTSRWSASRSRRSGPTSA